MTPPLPALLGGEPFFPDGPPDWPIRDQGIRSALESCWDDGSWGRYQGGRVAELERRLAEYHGVEHVLTCGSGTFAVELALRALKVGPGDEVLLSAYDYPGHFHAIHAVGAVPVLVDLQAEDWNLDPEAIPRACSPSTRAVIVSHLHGGMVAMRRLQEIARERGLAIIEDACQCPGAMLEGRRAGSWGDVGVLSFGGSKLLTAGRGGALLTMRPDILQRARIVQNRASTVCPLSELQAAVLIPQLAQLDERNATRLRAVQRLEQGLAGVPGLRLFRRHSEPAFYKVGFQLQTSELGLSRALFLRAMRAEGIALDEGFAAIHVGRSPSRLRRGGSLAEAERAHHGCVVLHHPILLGGTEAIDRVALAVRRVWHQREQLNRG